MAAFCFSNTRILFACPVVLHGEVGRFRIQRSYVVNQMLSKTMNIPYLNVRESFIPCDIETLESLLLEDSSKFLPPTCSPLLSCSCLFPISCSPSPLPFSSGEETKTTKPPQTQNRRRKRVLRGGGKSFGWMEGGGRNIR